MVAIHQKYCPNNYQKAKLHGTHYFPMIRLYMRTPQTIRRKTSKFKSIGWICTKCNHIGLDQPKKKIKCLFCDEVLDSKTEKNIHAFIERNEIQNIEKQIPPALIV